MSLLPPCIKAPVFHSQHNELRYPWKLTHLFADLPTSRTQACLYSKILQLIIFTIYQQCSKYNPQFRRLACQIPLRTRFCVTYILFFPTVQVNCTFHRLLSVCSSQTFSPCNTYAIHPFPATFLLHNQTPTALQSL